MLLGESTFGAPSPIRDALSAERNHQGMPNELIQPLGGIDGQSVVRRRPRMGGMLTSTIERPRSGIGDNEVGAVLGRSPLRTGYGSGVRADVATIWSVVDLYRGFAEPRIVSAFAGVAARIRC